MGKFEFFKDFNFVKIVFVYIIKLNIYLYKEVYKVFLKMYVVVKEDGIILCILLVIRNFNS